MRPAVWLALIGSLGFAVVGAFGGKCAAHGHRRCPRAPQLTARLLFGAVHPVWLFPHTLAHTLAHANVHTHTHTHTHTLTAPPDGGIRASVAVCA